MPASDSFIRWVTPTVAGLRQPGRGSKLESDLEALEDAGINVLVSLTMQALPQTELARYGIRSRHFPIIGMGMPGLEAAMGLCDELSEWVRSGSKIAVHCTQGVGRTGTVLACHLVWQGAPALEAIERVRQRIPGAIQTSGQQAFVYRLADARDCGRSRSR